jgi:hypothetical protein
MFIAFSIPEIRDIPGALNYLIIGPGCSVSRLVSVIDYRLHICRLRLGKSWLVILGLRIVNSRLNVNDWLAYVYFWLHF